MPITEIQRFELPLSLKSHDFLDLVVNSKSLQGNPLGDSPRRHNYVLVPKGKVSKRFPLIFHLSGYFSNGPTQFGSKPLSLSFVEKLDQGVQDGIYPKAVHIFVDATTYWGGSQFINSHGCGKYSDYLLQDLFSSVHDNLPVLSSKEHTCVMGGSSGGYGALALISEKDSPFGIAFATAPDSYFEASLLPELYKAAPELAKFASMDALKKEIAKGEIQEKKSFFSLANAIAMAHCYSPKKAFKKGSIEFPIDLYTGEIKSELWADWLKHDPVHFLKEKKDHFRKKVIHLDVGKYDNFSLQFGTRQIAQILKKAKISHSYSEFSGNHFGLSERRLQFLKTLGKNWGLDAK